MTDTEIVNAVLELARSMNNCQTDYSMTQHPADRAAVVLKAEITFRKIIDVILSGRKAEASLSRRGEKPETQPRGD